MKLKRGEIIFTIIMIGIIVPLSFSQTYSSITYGQGTGIMIGTGADVCANDIFINGAYSGGGTICQGALPVTMLTFTCSVNKRNVMLSWSTGEEINNSGFEIERSPTPQKLSTKQRNRQGTFEWVKIGFVKGNGTTNEPSNYIYEDKKLSAGTFSYRLKQIDYNGNHEYFQLESDVVIVPPNVFSISQNYPNPSNPKSKIDYEIPVNGNVSIKLYDLLGQEVRNIVNEFKEAGYYTAGFDGTNLASGVYFYRITADGNDKKFTKSLKMMLVK